MKLKIFAVLITIVVLCCFHEIWFSWKSRIIVQTDKETEITLKWRRSGKNKLYAQTVKSNQDGKAVFDTKHKEITFFSLKNSEKVKSIFYRGWKKVSFIPNNTLTYENIKLRARERIDFYNLVVISALTFYSVIFFINAYKNRHQPKEPEKFPKYMNIEFLRILFTLFVISCHFISSLGIWNSAYLSVEFFFILSGFLFFLTFNKELSVLDFIKNKLIRFYPLIIFSAIICGVFRTKIDIPNMLSDFLFLQVPFFHWEVGLAPAAWYVVTLFWVLVFFFYFLKTQRRETMNIIIGCLVFFMYGGIVQYGSSIDSAFGYKGDIGYIIKAYLARGVAGVGTGYLLAQIWQQTKDVTIVRYKLYSFFEFSLLFVLILGFYYQGAFLQNILYYVIGFSVLIWMFVQNKGAVSRFLNRPVFVKIARYALAVYLMQGITVWEIFPRILARYPVLRTEYKPFTIIITLSVACVIGVFAHYLVEKPATKKLKEWLG